MAKKEEIANSIFRMAGYPHNYNRRNRWFKALAELLDSGLITFELCEPGKIWSLPNAQPKTWRAKFNIKVKGMGQYTGGYISQTTRGNWIQPYNVLKVAGKFLQSPTVKEKINSYVNLDLTCPRCSGMGYIPRFSYYCDGICFECFGSGYSPKKKIVVEILDSKNK